MTDTLEHLPIAALAREAKAWPFEEARKVIARYEGRDWPEAVVFETGYGPSGLPHLGTFGEVARTTMVRHAFEVLTGGRVPTRLVCFSDDMDGMRKVPDTVPEDRRDAMREHMDKPLSSVPNPFGGDEPSFAAYNNAMLRRFLDRFGFDYEFASATDYYRSGRFDGTLRLAAERYDQIMDVMLPTLGPERRATYSPFLPIHPETGRVLYVPMRRVDAAEGTVTFEAEGREFTLPITGGNVKLQWKPDFGMRWAALGVDYEMFGKDHQSNMQVYDRICAILGGRPPEHFVYELFLDANGEKISKSKGNGLTIDEWLAYAPAESLAYYNYGKPRTAKRLHFDVIPKAVDEYWSQVAAYARQDGPQRLENPAYHIHGGDVPDESVPVPFALLLKLVSASNAKNRDVLWGFISRYAPGVTAETHPALDALVGHALAYYRDFVEPEKRYRAPDETERDALAALEKELAKLDAAHRERIDAALLSQAERRFGRPAMGVPSPSNFAPGEPVPTLDPAVIQDAVLDAGRGFERYRDPKKTGPNGQPAVTRAWFAALYELLMGETSGPRFGTFVALYGIDNTRKLIGEALAR